MVNYNLNQRFNFLPKSSSGFNEVIIFTEEDFDKKSKRWVKFKLTILAVETRKICYYCNYFSRE